jgi:hypothetical protein
VVLGIVKGTILIPQKHLLLLQGVVGEENLPVFGPSDQLIFLVGHTHNDMILNDTDTRPDRAQLSLLRNASEASLCVGIADAKV